MNTPVEALERAYPMRVLRYRLRREAAEPDKCTIRMKAGDVLRLLTPRWRRLGRGVGVVRTIP